MPKVWFPESSEFFMKHPVGINDVLVTGLTNLVQKGIFWPFDIITNVLNSFAFLSEEYMSFRPKLLLSLNLHHSSVVTSTFSEIIRRRCFLHPCGHRLTVALV